MTSNGQLDLEATPADITLGDLADALGRKVEQIKREIKLEYKESHGRPWIVGFSGGKDSTLVLHLVVEAILELPASERVRPVYVVSNDTLVESPIVQTYVDSLLDFLADCLPNLSIPISVVKTTPETSQTFWVNLIGRGYPSPTRLFRWCTDRMKIRPTMTFILDKVAQNGEVILLLGVRRSESSARAASAKKYDNGGRLNPHNDIAGCMVFRPILEMNTEDVWEFLMSTPAPWGGTHDALVQLYRDAVGGECPVVIDPDAQPSCGSSSIRFGCWTCTVVEKDKSFRNHLEKGFEALEPMAEFRDWLKGFCYSPENRMTERRNGNPGTGPLTFSARQRVLEELLRLQKQVGRSLISSDEIAQINRIWDKDRSTIINRKTSALLNILEGTRDAK